MSEMSDNIAKWLKDNPGKDLEATLRFDRKAIDEMDNSVPDVDNFVGFEAKCLWIAVRNGIRKYLKEKADD